MGDKGLSDPKWPHGIHLQDFAPEFIVNFSSPLVTWAGNPCTVDQNVYWLLDLLRSLPDLPFIGYIELDNLQFTGLGQVLKIGSRLRMPASREHPPTVGFILPRKLQS